VIRCLLRPSNELRRAMEMLNRYIDGERKRDQTTNLRGIENSDAEYGLVAHGNLAAAAPPASTRLRPIVAGTTAWQAATSHAS